MISINLSMNECFQQRIFFKNVCIHFLRTSYRKFEEVSNINNDYNGHQTRQELLQMITYESSNFPYK